MSGIFRVNMTNEERRACSSAWRRLTAPAPVRRRRRTLFLHHQKGYRAWPLRTYNPKVVGSNPAPATTKPNTFAVFSRPSGLGWIISRAPFVNPSSGYLR